jgi:cytochrome c553
MAPKPTLECKPRTHPGIDILPTETNATTTMKSIVAIAFAFAMAASAARADTAENWTHLCASCHGKDGAGHTKPGKKKGVKDLTSADYQKKFTDDDAFNSLKKGLKSDDGATVKMNPFADKLSDDEIKALVSYVRTLAK